MALLSVIRRWHLRDHLPIREIARRTGLSRNTIRKYLRAGTVEPRFKVPERPSKLDPFAERLSAWLKREMGRPRKQMRTVKQLHADLVALGYDGSYGRVAAFARAWRDDYRQAQQMSGRGTYVPLAFAPGEAFQFDWSEDWAIIDGVRWSRRHAPYRLAAVGFVSPLAEPDVRLSLRIRLSRRHGEVRRPHPAKAIATHRGPTEQMLLSQPVTP